MKKSDIIKFIIRQILIIGLSWFLPIIAYIIFAVFFFHDITVNNFITISFLFLPYPVWVFSIIHSIDFSKKIPNENKNHFINFIIYFLILISIVSIIINIPITKKSFNEHKNTITNKDK